jgi:chromosome segregation ATPase
LRGIAAGAFARAVVTGTGYGTISNLMVPPLASVPDLDRELDTLYELPLEDFTKARNDLVARLRKAHQSEAAAAVRGLKKPTVVAWAANRLAREEPKLTVALLDAGEQLRETQQRALSGNAKQEELAEAAGAEREAIRALLTAARRRFGDRATSALLDKLSQTLRAAAVDPAARPLLARGRLTEELKAVGFGPLEAVKPTARRGDEVGRAARERVSALRAEARRLSADAREAEREFERAEQALESLREEAQEKRAAAESVARELAEAEEALRERR